VSNPGKISLMINQGRTEKPQAERRPNEMKNEKQTLYVCGIPMRPVVTGTDAIYASDGKICRTSRVMAVHKRTDDSIHFETADAHYHLSTTPFPTNVAGAIRLLPTKLAVCA